MNTSGSAATGSATSGTAREALLELESVEVIYDRVSLVLRGISLAVHAGEVVALLGANGAGKSTALKAISGLLETERGEVSRGAIRVRGADLRGRDAAARVRLGVSLVMEGRHVFEHLTVHENLVAGGYSRAARSSDFERVYAFLPRLGALRGRVAGYLSGGEQQLLAIGRALMAEPALLLLDEPSLGLAPRLVEEVFGIIARLNAELGLSVLLIEQNAAQALALAQRGYVLEAGRIVLEGASAELASNPDVKEFYLGLTEAGRRRNYRDTKHYKRRKRWL
jgi:branched-chain amino acid transport system ATP-binding protein